MAGGSQLDPIILAVMKETGEQDPETAVRIKARRLVQRFVEKLGGSPPLNLQALASFCDLLESGDAPQFSEDSEIAPDPNGRIVLRVNRDRPHTRQRFSIGHEIGHTLFPEYEQKVRCRKASERDWAEPTDFLETLCDITASEFLFPEPWFRQRIEKMALSAKDIVELAEEYKASREATARRFVEIRREPLAAVFLSWKLKPTEIRQEANDRFQLRLFDDLPRPQRKLRVDYAIVNNNFARKCGKRIPKDKSIPSEGPIYEASLNQEPRDGEMRLDFGKIARAFKVYVLPIYTPLELMRAEGGGSVVAILEPASD